MKKLLPILFLFLATSGHSASDPWLRALSPRSWSFPRDHGSHPEFKTEWWYLTGNLDDEKGNPFGYELTFFRHGLQPVPTQPGSAWSIRDISFAHLALTDVRARRFLFSEKLSRGALGEVEISQKDMQIRLAGWTLRRDPDSTLTFSASDPAVGIGLELSATPVKPLTLQGHQGLSRKSATAGHASHYYSFTRLKTKGTLQIGPRQIPVQGLSWFDHEFSSSALAADQEGWDWFCLQFDSGDELMLYRMRNSGHRTDAASSGTWIPAQGKSSPLQASDFTLTPLDEWKTASGATYPSGWKISVPSLQLSGEVQPLLLNQELQLKRTAKIRYWEGACRFQGTRLGKVLTGRGYTELTGYASPIGQGMKE